MMDLCKTEIGLISGGMGSRGYVVPKTPAMQQCENGLFWGAIGGGIAGAAGGPLGFALGVLGGIIGGGGSAGCFSPRPTNAR